MYTWRVIAPGPAKRRAVIAAEELNERCPSVLPQKNLELIPHSISPLHRRRAHPPVMQPSQPADVRRLRRCFPASPDWRTALSTMYICTICDLHESLLRNRLAERFGNSQDRRWHNYADCTPPPHTHTPTLIRYNLEVLLYLLYKDNLNFWNIWQ